MSLLLKSQLHQKVLPVLRWGLNLLSFIENKISDSVSVSPIDNTSSLDEC